MHIYTGIQFGTRMIVLLFLIPFSTNFWNIAPQFVFKEGGTYLFFLLARKRNAFHREHCSTPEPRTLYSESLLPWIPVFNPLTGLQLVLLSFYKTRGECQAKVLVSFVQMFVVQCFFYFLFELDVILGQQEEFHLTVFHTIIVISQH